MRDGDIFKSGVPWYLKLAWLLITMSGAALLGVVIFLIFQILT